jgi:hypothetical protein
MPRIPPGRGCEIEVAREQHPAARLTHEWPRALTDFGERLRRTLECYRRIREP